MKILFFLPNLEGGGAQRVVLNLASGFAAQNHEVVLVVAISSGSLLNDVPKQVKFVNLGLSRSSKAVLPLMRIIKSEKPDYVYSRMNYANIITAFSSILGRTKAKLVLTIANTLTQYQLANKLRAKLVLALEKFCYSRASVVVANSRDTYNDLLNAGIVKAEKLKIIYNPVVDVEKINDKQNQPLDHPWLNDKTTPVLISVGRLTRQKNYPFLIKCFAELKKQSNARLIILGEGTLEVELKALISAYNLTDDISMPGFVNNPYPYYKHADVFVLTSLWEGFGNVVVEALACGCKVVAANCPGGPKEIIDGGKYGALVNGYDEVEFAAAILGELNNKRDERVLITRAADFTIEKIVKQYADLFLTLS